MELEKNKDSKLEVHSQNQKSNRKTLLCQVTGIQMNKTISVCLTQLVKHKKYEKYIRRKSIFKAHDEKNEAQLGDIVLISSHRPISKTKRWLLKKIITPSKLRNAGEMALEKELTLNKKEKEEVVVEKKTEKEKEKNDSSSNPS